MSHELDFDAGRARRQQEKQAMNEQRVRLFIIQANAAGPAPRGFPSPAIRRPGGSSACRRAIPARPRREAVDRLGLWSDEAMLALLYVG